MHYRKAYDAMARELLPPLAPGDRLDGHNARVEAVTLCPRCHGPIYWARFGDSSLRLVDRTGAECCANRPRRPKRPTGTEAQQLPLFPPDPC